MYEDEHLEADYEDRYTTLADWDAEDDLDIDSEIDFDFDDESDEESYSDMYNEYDEWDTFYNTDLSRIMY
jgi:hypothetical protein